MVQYRKYMVKFTWLICLSLAWLAMPVFGQKKLNIASDYLTFSDGYNVGRTYGGIAQDSLGRVWVVGEWRVACFDGSKILYYDASDTLQASGFRTNGHHSVITDSEGKIWVAGTSGLYQFDYRTDSFMLALPPDPDLGWQESHRRIIADKPRNLLWMTDKTGLYSYHLPTQKWQKLFHLNKKPGHFNILKSGHLILSSVDTTYNTWVIDPDKKKIIQRLPEIISAYQTPEALWLGTWRFGLLKVNTQTWNIEVFNPEGKIGVTAPIFSALVYAPDLSGKEMLICGTLENGYWYFNMRTQQFEAKLRHEETKISGLQEPIIESMFVDNGNVLWILQADGLSRIAPYKQALLQTRFKWPGLTNEQIAVTNILRQKSGSKNLWASVAYYGLISYNESTNTIEKWWQQSDQEKLIPNERRYHTRIALDRENNLWVTDTSGFLVVNTKGIHNHIKCTELNLNNAAIYTLKFDKNNIGWLGASTGLFRLEPKTGKVKRITKFGLQIHDLICTEAAVVCATPEGILRWEHSTASQQFVSKSKLFFTAIAEKNDKIYALDEKQVWAVLQDTILPISKIDLLTGTHTQSLAVDSFGFIWVKTASEAIKIDPETHKKTTFEIGGYGFCTMQDDTWFIPFKGFIPFNPLTLSTFQITKKPIITAVKHFEKRLPVNLQVENEFSWTQRSLTFEFSCPDFTSGSLTQIEVNLEGLDSSWQKQGERRSITYTNLEPGNYTFRVRAANLSGKMHPEYSVFSFAILPPFYRTWWFLGLCLAAGILLIRNWIKWRVNQIRKEEQAKTEFQRMKAETETRALQAQMNPHFIFNCMNTIEAYIYDDKPDEASAFLQKFSKLIRSVLENAQQDYVLIREDIEVLEWYIQLEQVRANNRWQYQIKIDNMLLEQNYSIPPLILQPFIENAILHGLYHRADAGGLVQLEIYPNPQEQLLIVQIADNGVGRDYTATKKKHSSSKKKSLGIVFTTERIHHLNTNGQSKYKIIYTDIKDHQGMAAGTAVTLYLPLIKAEETVKAAEKTLASPNNKVKPK